MPECIPIVRVNDSRIGSDVVFHKQIHIVIIDARVNITQEFTRYRITLCVEQLAGHIGSDSLPGALIKIDLSCIVTNDETIQRESAVIQRSIRRTWVTITSPYAVSCSITNAGFLVGRPALRILPLLHMELYPVVGVGHVSEIVLPLRKRDVACGQLQSVVFLQLGIRNRRTSGRICLPGFIISVQRIFLIREVFFAVGCKLNKCVFILYCAGTRAVTAGQTVERNLSAFGGCT